MSIVLVVAPHPDDETLGCGGALLRHAAEGDEVHWLIMTTSEGADLPREMVDRRAKEIQDVVKRYSFTSVQQASFVTTRLDTYPVFELIGVVSETMKRLQPEIVYLPYCNDVHSDHAVVFDAATSCTKSFRHPFLKKVRVYETLSETEVSIRPGDAGFKPNLWIDITGFLDQKIDIMRIYEGEMGEHPFPRSERNLRALATLRGSTAGVEAAEAFISVKEIL